MGSAMRGRMYGRLKRRAGAQPPPGSWFLGRGGRQGDEGEGRESLYASRDLEKMFLHIAPSGISIDHDVKYGRLGWWDCTCDPILHIKSPRLLRVDQARDRDLSLHKNAQPADLGSVQCP
jgi:hypothetical protein